MKYHIQLIPSALLVSYWIHAAHGWIPCLQRNIIHDSRSNPRNPGPGRLSGDGCLMANENKSITDCSKAVRSEKVMTRSQFWERTAAIVATGTTSSVLMPPDTAHAMTTNPKTGIILPDDGEIAAAVPTDWSVVENPFEETPAKFSRLDSTSDSIFYKDPRFVEHVDDQAVGILTSYISNEVIGRGKCETVLDLCSSWTSHIELPPGEKLNRVSGLGMNANELEKNKLLDDWLVRDLNENPVLPYDDNTFDAVLCQLSIDYLTRPKDVLKEVGRVLRPQGMVYILFSNRLFLSKAIALWTGADDIDHTYTVACYLRFCDGGFEKIQAKDLSVRKGQDKRIAGDPVYVVTAQARA